MEGGKEGERFSMEEGDLILTPNWSWHDHFNGSKQPIIWLEGLDGPLIQSLNVSSSSFTTKKRSL